MTCIVYLQLQGEWMLHAKNVFLILLFQVTWVFLTSDYWFPQTCCFWSPVALALGLAGRHVLKIWKMGWFSKTRHTLPRRLSFVWLLTQVLCISNQLLESFSLLFLLKWRVLVKPLCEVCASAGSGDKWWWGSQIQKLNFIRLPAVFILHISAIKPTS